VQHNQPSSSSSHNSLPPKNKTNNAKTGGVEKLEQAASEVDGLQRELTQARAVVAAAAAECDALLADIAA
jgi:hypothetical protein